MTRLIAEADRIERDALALAELRRELRAYEERHEQDVRALVDRLMTHVDRHGGSDLKELAYHAELEYHAARGTPCERVACGDCSGAGHAPGPASVQLTITSGLDDSGSEWDSTDSDSGDDSGSTDIGCPRGASKAAVPGGIAMRQCGACSATKTTQWRNGPDWKCNKCYARAQREKKPGAHEQQRPGARSARPVTRSSIKRRHTAERDASEVPTVEPPNKRRATGGTRRALESDEYIVHAIGERNDDGLYDVSWEKTSVTEKELRTIRKYWASHIENVSQHPSTSGSFVVRWKNTWEPKENLLRNEIYQKMMMDFKPA